MKLPPLFPFSLAWLLPTLLLFAVRLEAEPKQWQTYDGYNPEGYGRHIVFISGDEEYRSEEALPMLAKIMAVHHGFRTTVLFAQHPDHPGIINPQIRNHIPGLEALRTADLMVIATRFRALPDEQMEEIDSYLRSGRPVVGLRTANHGFRFPEESKWHHYSWQYRGEKSAWAEGFGGAVLGSWFFSHHGWHKHESTRGIIENGAEENPILNEVGKDSVWGPTDVYGVKEPIPGEDVEILLRGQVLSGMNPNDDPIGPGPYEKAPDYIVEGSNDKNDPMQALAWTKSYQIPNGRKGRAFCTTMGSSTDLVAEGTRRLIVNAMFWSLGMEIPAETVVDFVDPYDPSDYHTHKREYWEERQLKVSDFDLKAELFEPGGAPHGEPAKPYLDVTEGREGNGYDFADHPVNRHRLYNFHRRQAAHYLNNEETPPLLANMPDLDGGVFGHWGKLHKNGYKDRRWNLMELGPAMAGVFRGGGETLPRAVAVQLSDDLACLFDTETLRVTHLWKGGFVRFDEHRWGIGNGIAPDGDLVDFKAGEPREGRYLGHSLKGDEVSFHFYQGDSIWILTPRQGKEGELEIDLNEAPPEMTSLAGASRYADKPILLSGAIGDPIPGSPFAIDRIPVPLHNEFGSLMFIGGHDFFSNGEAAVCTMMGDVWRVSGLDESLEAVTWTRIATGLSQALGLAVHDDQIYVTCRDRIVRLNDWNDDGEIDFYENFCDDFEVSAGSHDFSTGLQRDENGYFYFISGKLGVVQVSPDGATAEVLANGLRNTNGIGVTPRDSIVVTSTNQGDWTPASAVFEVQKGDFYGRRATEEGDP
ncbi:MAG: hypothetical protein AAF733_07115, partial [Verrucomicrobiota bacterium]